jgi:methyl-accepting chemotaxis protein
VLESGLKNRSKIMKKEILYREIEKDLAELDKVLKIAKKEAGVEKAINNVKENMKFQAAQLGEYKKREEEFGQIVIRWSDVLEKLTKQGDLSARIETSKLSDKHKIVGKNINRMADFLQNNIEELRKAIGSYSKVLNKIALGELSARIDVEQLKEEYKLLGEFLNTIAMRSSKEMLSLVKWCHISVRY